MSNGYATVPNHGYTLPHVRGVHCRPDGGVPFVVLGGPTKMGVSYARRVAYAMDAYYTVLALDDGLLDSSGYGGRPVKLKQGETTLLPEAFITDHRVSLVWTELGIQTQIQRIKNVQAWDSSGYPGIPVQDCPNCEIDEMIFYEGDYICAWCREMLEE